ncbi:hypothetical protein B9Z51_07140 [Limnohabitans sp. T6-5]|nr:hypothetical protein B9Z51_07140 [Limnohabitans sp. T6-5]
MWKGLQESIKRLMQSAFLVALLPVLLVMVDPLFNGYFYNGNVMTFEEYQRYLQSTLFWSTTFLIFCLNALRCHYFSRLAIYVRDRQRDQEITGKD